MKRGICTDEGDNFKFIFARTMPLFGLRIFSEIFIFEFKCDQKPFI